MKVRKKLLKSLLFTIALLTSYVISLTSSYADLPSSSNYKLQNYSFGAGGTTNAASANYGLNGMAGEVEFGQSSSTNFQVGSGLTYMLNVNVPGAPTLSTPNNSYDRILFILNTSSNPTDVTYALQISTTSNFSSDVNYIKSDGTVGSTLATTDFQSYTSWGGASGTYVTGLSNGTTYYIRAAAKQGDYTQTAWGPAAVITTNYATLTFTINNPTINFDNLNGGNSYTDATKSDTLTTTTNSVDGFTVYGRETQALTSDNGSTINNYLSPNSSPTSWSGTGFGYTTSDATLNGSGGANRFNNGSYYAGFGSSAPGDPVDDNTGPVTSDVVTVSYRVTANNSTPAGTYKNTIIYTIMPSY
jgi:hypothetical protein